MCRKISGEEKEEGASLPYPLPDPSFSGLLRFTLIRFGETFASDRLLVIVIPASFPTHPLTVTSLKSIVANLLLIGSRDFAFLAYATRRDGIIHRSSFLRNKKFLPQTPLDDSMDRPQARRRAYRSDGQHFESPDASPRMYSLIRALLEHALCSIYANRQT